MRLKPYTPYRGDGEGAPAGYACLPYYGDVLPPVSCSDYLDIPGYSDDTVTDAAWEDLSAVTGDSRLLAIPELCGIEFDPFEGTVVDLYQAFLDNGMGSVIEDDCYPAGDSGYHTGSLNSLSFTMGHGC